MKLLSTEEEQLAYDAAVEKMEAFVMGQSSWVRVRDAQACCHTDKSARTVRVPYSCQSRKDRPASRS